MNAAPQSPSGTDNDNDAPKGKDVATAANTNGLVELQQFLAETYQEFKKISWPSRQQVIQETWTVLVLVSVITGAVLGFDYAIAKVVFEPLDKFAKHMGGGVGKEREQKWAPVTPEPGTPTNQPGAPASTPAPATTPAPTSTTAPAPQTPAGQPSGAPAGAPPANTAPAGQTSGSK